MVNNAVVHQMIFVKAPSHQTKMFGYTRTLGRKHPFLAKGWRGYFFSVQLTKNIAKFLFLTSQPHWPGEWEGESAVRAGLTPTELNDPPGQPYSDQPAWFGERRASAKSVKSALRGRGSGHAFCHSVFVYSELLARPLAQYDSHRRRRSDDLFWFGKIR